MAKSKLETKIRMAAEDGNVPAQMALNDLMKENGLFDPDMTEEEILNRVRLKRGDWVNITTVTYAYTGQVLCQDEEWIYLGPGVITTYETGPLETFDSGEAKYCEFQKGVKRVRRGGIVAVDDYPPKRLPPVRTQS